MSDCEICGGSGVSTDPDVRMCDCMVAEIARLREELDVWKNAANNGYPHPCTLGPLCPYCEITRLRARIAELEAELKAAELKMYYPDQYGYAVVREGNIDAAWELRAKRLKDAKIFPIAQAYADGIDEALRGCGIVACEECGGSKVLYSTITNQATPCPACHRNGKSHGWVWAAEVTG